MAGSFGKPSCYHSSQGQLPWAPLGHRRHLEPLRSQPSLPHAALLQQEFSHTCTRASRFRRSPSRLAPMLLLRPLLVRGRDTETWLTGLFCSRRSPLGATESRWEQRAAQGPYTRAVADSSSWFLTCPPIKRRACRISHLLFLPLLP